MLFCILQLTDNQFPLDFRVVTKFNVPKCQFKFQHHGIYFTNNYMMQEI